MQLQIVHKIPEQSQLIILNILHAFVYARITSTFV